MQALCSSTSRSQLIKRSPVLCLCGSAAPGMSTRQSPPAPAAWTNLRSIRARPSRSRIVIARDLCQSLQLAPPSSCGSAKLRFGHVQRLDWERDMASPQTELILTTIILSYYSPSVVCHVQFLQEARWPGECCQCTHHRGETVAIVVRPGHHASCSTSLVYYQLFTCRPRLPWPSQTLTLRRSQKSRANLLEER